MILRKHSLSKKVGLPLKSAIAVVKNYKVPSTKMMIAAATATASAAATTSGFIRKLMKRLQTETNKQTRPIGPTMRPDIDGIVL